jgi:hypothetical protein
MSHKRYPNGYVLFCDLEGGTHVDWSRLSDQQKEEYHSRAENLPTGYELFFQTKNEVLSENPYLSGRERVQQIQEQWSNLNRVDKDRWRQKAGWDSKILSPLPVPIHGKTKAFIMFLEAQSNGIKIDRKDIKEEDEEEEEEEEEEKEEEKEEDEKKEEDDEEEDEEVKEEKEKPKVKHQFSIKSLTRDQRIALTEQWNQMDPYKRAYWFLKARSRPHIKPKIKGMCGYRLFMRNNTTIGSYRQRRLAWRKCSHEERVDWRLNALMFEDKQ